MLSLFQANNSPMKKLIFYTGVHTVSVHTLVNEFTSVLWFDLGNSNLIVEFC